MSILTAFLNKLNFFLQDLTERFPNERELRKIHNAVSMTQSITPRQILDRFIATIAPCYIPIFDRTDSFFHDLDFKNLITIQNQASKQHYLTIANHLKSVWDHELSNKEKDNIWEHFQVLLTLGSVASSKNYDHIIAYANYIDLLNSFQKFRKINITTNNDKSREQQFKELQLMSEKLDEAKLDHDIKLQNYGGVIYNFA